MSHKKRASTALKSMGAAGLAAATIVSGLSFSLPAASASTERDRSVVAETKAARYTAKIVLQRGSSFLAFKSDGYPARYNSLSAAKNAAMTGTFPAPGTSGKVQMANGYCLSFKNSGGRMGTAAYPHKDSACGNTPNWTVTQDGYLKAGTWGFMGEIYSYGTYLNNVQSDWYSFQPTLEQVTFPLEAKASSVNHIEGTAVVSGTATSNGTVTINGQVANVNASGAWSMTVTGLAEGANTLTAIQKVNNTEVDRKNVVVTINNAAIIGQDGAAVALERGETTSVESLFETKGSVSRPQGKVEFTAPAGTTFAADQGTINGAYKKPGEAWTNSSMTLTNGVRSEDGTKYTYDFVTTTTTWNLPDASLMRWNINVNTPEDADGGTFPMRTVLSGTAVEGAFNATSETTTTLETAERELTAEVASVDNEARSAVVTGTATPGADISIGDETAKADATTGAWSITVDDLEVGDNALVVVQKINDREIDRKTVTATVEGRTELAPITLSGPASVTPGRSNTFTGTAEPGATFRVLNVSGTQIVPGTFEVGADGRWSFDRVVSNGASNFRFVIEQTKNGQVAKSELFTVNASALAPVTVTTPAAVRPGLTNTFTGTAEPGATFRVLNVSGTQIVPGTFEVDAQGNWTFARVVSAGASNFRFVIEQTKNGQVEKSELFTINAAALAPVTVTTPERVTPGRSNTFTGTGEPGATFRVLNISGTQIVPGTHEVDAQGNWTFDRVVSNGASNFRFVIEQTKNGQVEKSELFTINAADFAPVTVANRSVTPGAVNTFTGTGEPGASYRVLNITGTQIVPGTFEIDAEGNWTFDRAVSRGATEFRFALEQTKNGKVELSELFTLPADTK
ncbi:hypothetical protein [Curtobacterium sp. MCSS17_005]|uniref:hypothetical protein n=1 Tax=Curtobacterium sp. MCSS17_005 TaxID=2175641 RepID=UPI0011B505D2|nr:hypothetical protein [Curtobacterium sp. MCSS17_005]WIB33394.1 hypothetical protein DEJ20_02720 [Curtobacterium sp. MCSS17_005]